MPQQLIYTSAPQGVDAGRSGYCTVARSSTMSESLAQRLEQCSYYERLSEHGGEQERVIYNFRNIDIRGKVYHVLSRIQDAPADYTGRTNFIAHHLVFSPDEVANKSANIPTPAVILRHWPDWKKNWEQEPTLIDNESEPKLNDFHNVSHLPAVNWYRETGNRGRAAALLGHSAGVFTANDFKPEIILDLLTESLELLQLEGDNWRSLAWQRTFSVGCQPQDNPADFRWRFLTSNLPFESSTTQGRAPLELKGLRGSPNSRQLDFAEKGPGKPKFMRLPEAGKPVQIDEGQPLELDGQADSLPGPCIYQWVRIEKDKETEITQNAQLVDPNVRRGKNYYKVRAWDQRTDKFDESHQIVVEVKEKVKILSLSHRPASTSGPAFPSSQGTKSKNEQKSKVALTINRRKQETSNFKLEEGDFATTSFLNRYKNGILWLGCISLIVVISYILLSHYNFWKPYYSGIKGLEDWWHAEIRSNPEHFKDDESLKTNTRDEIKKFLDPKSQPKHPVGVVIQLIIEDIQERHSSTNKVNPKPAKSKKVEAASPLPSTIQPKSADADSAPPPPTPDSSPQVHLAIIKPQDPLDSRIEHFRQQIRKLNEQIPKLNESKNKSEEALKNAQKKAKEANEKTLEKLKAEIIASTNQLQNLKGILLKLEEKAASQTISELKDQIARNKFFDTNTPPQLVWRVLGETTSAPPFSGVPIKSGLQFTNAGKWSLSLTTNKGNQAVAVLSNNRSDLPIIVEITSQQEPVLLLKFLLLPSKTNENTFFDAVVDKDILKPQKKLDDFLRSIKPEHHQFIRTIIKYPGLDNLPTYSVDQIVSMLDKNSWKLTIEDQLAGQKTKSNEYKEISKVIADLEAVWGEVREENQQQLRDEKFWPTDKFGRMSKDKIGQQIKSTIIERVNRLIDVAIYKEDKRKEYLTKECKYTDAVEKINNHYSGAGHTNHKEKIIGLIEAAATPPATEDRARPHLAQLMQFLDSPDRSPEDFSSDSFKTHGFPGYIQDKIKQLEKNDKSLKPNMLDVYLEYQNLDDQWVPFAKINCI